MRTRTGTALLGAGLSAVITLSACGGDGQPAPTPQEIIGNMTFDERIDFDYSGGLDSLGSGIYLENQDCLPQAYDPIPRSSEAPAAAVTPGSAEAFIDVVPTTPGAAVLHFVISNGERPLQPADKFTSDFLAGYHCLTDRYSTDVLDVFDDARAA